jgi:hypothetical protein
VYLLIARFGHVLTHLAKEVGQELLNGSARIQRFTISVVIFNGLTVVEAFVEGFGRNGFSRVSEPHIRLGSVLVLKLNKE